MGLWGKYKDACREEKLRKQGWGRRDSSSDLVGHSWCPLYRIQKVIHSWLVMIIDRELKRSAGAQAFAPALLSRASVQCVH